MKRQHFPAVFDLLIDPFESEGSMVEPERAIAEIGIPAYTGSGWYAYGYKTHLNGAQNYFRMTKSPKKLLLCGSAQLERPFHGLSAEMLRWYDHWLKDIDTGVLAEPAVRYWVTGAETWRLADDWPPPETRWTKLFLTSWERPRSEPFIPSSLDAGPAVLNLSAANDQADTNWIIVIKDIGPDPHPLSAREGERDIAADVPIREVTRGWLKASNRALDESRSECWRPWHKLTRAAAQPVVAGQIEHYAIEIMSSAHLYRAGHRLCVEINNMDVPTGVGGATNAEYIPYHVCSARTITHHVYHDSEHPSHLLLPVIPLQNS